jgi:RNA polymerase sigma-70 factor (ECF subfamily)
MKKRVDDIQSLLSGCRQGDRRAQHELFSRFGPKMLGICRRYCANPDDARDALQEGFIKVFATLEKYRGESAFETWMTRIFINTAIDLYKKKNKISQTELPLPGQYEADVSSDTDVDNWGFPCSPEEAIKAMDQLPQGYRLVFNLHALENYAHKDIASMLGISEGTSKSQYARARRFLQQILIPKNITS